MPRRWALSRHLNAKPRQQSSSGRGGSLGSRHRSSSSRQPCLSPCRQRSGRRRNALSRGGNVHGCRDDGLNRDGKVLRRGGKELRRGAMALIATVRFVDRGENRQVAAQTPVDPPSMRPLATGMTLLAAEKPRNAARNDLGGTAIPGWQREMRFIAAAMLMAHTRKHGVAAEKARIATETPESGTETPRGRMRIPGATARTSVRLSGEPERIRTRT